MNIRALLFSSILSLSSWTMLGASAQDYTQQDNQLLPIKVAYPPANSNIQAASTFIVGQITAGNVLTCNGQPVKVNQNGFFAHVVSLQYGTNHFLLSSAPELNQKCLEQEVVITRKPPAKPIGLNELKIENASPNVSLGVKAGDIVNFSVHATPYSKVGLWLGKQWINLTSSNKPPNGESQDVAYGKVVQQGETNNSKISDVYKGSYRIQENDHFLFVYPKFELVHGTEKLSLIGKGPISTVENLSCATTAATPTVVRLGPGLARTTPLVEGVKILVDGWSGDNMRCLYSPNRHTWIKQKDLIVDQAQDVAQSSPYKKCSANLSAMIPQTVARTINITSNDYGEEVALPLTERLPYQIEQKLNPNCLILRVYGVAADTDWITTEPKENQDKSVIDHIVWRQTEDNVYEIVIYLPGTRQWGYKASYNGNTLCLNIKRSADVSMNNAATILSGVKVCLDPGHGGNERGSIGCSGLPESQLNFDITSKVKAYLEELGATVIMTRNSNNENPSLDNRVKIATDAQADFLISIHNNALPDGRDPWKEHGTSSYWYYPQAIELARCLKDAVKTASNFPDLGARYQNLALARAEAMPAVLLEIGFMINPDEFSQLIDLQFQTKIAQAIANGVKQYVCANISKQNI